MDIGIVITGSIIPNSPLVVHSNPEKRKQEYIRALYYYKRFAPVYFLENSSYPLLSDPDFVGIDNVFLRKFFVSKYFMRGKGYQEFEMLDNWLKSEIILPKRFIKITGRYLIVNFKQIFNECLKQKANCLIIDQFFRLSMSLSQLFYIDSNYYKENLTGIYLECDDEKGEWVERILYRKLLSSSINFRIFANEPRFLGIRGSTGKDMQDCYLRYLIKRVIRKFNYWIDNRYIYFRGNIEDVT